MKREISIQVGSKVTLNLAIQTTDVASHSFFSEHPRFLDDAAMLVQAALTKDLEAFNKKTALGGVDAHFLSR